MSRLRRKIDAVKRTLPPVKIQEGRHIRAVRPPAAKGVAGAPPIYDAVRFPHIANALCKEYGFTTDQMGRVFGVSPRTVTDWIGKYPDFKSAVQAGKDEFDGVKVENALLKLALGYEYEETSVRSVQLKGFDGEGHKIRVPAKETTKTFKVLPPNAKALLFWLTNRQPDRWKMVTTVNANINTKTEHTTRNLQVTADLSKMGTEQLKLLRDLVSNQPEQVQQLTEVIDTPMLEYMENARLVLEAEFTED
jgi:hypothetical protein